MMSTPFSEFKHKGLNVRPATLDDLEKAVTMFNRCSQEMIGIDEFTPANYRREWQAPGFDLERDTRLVLSGDNTIVGCVEVWADIDPPVHPWVWARVHPQWEGQGIGTEMLRWGKVRAIEATFDRVSEPYRISMYCGTYANHEASQGLLEGFGMGLIRQSYRMRIDFDKPLTKPIWPQGICVRTYNHAEDAEAVYLANDEAFRDHWGYVETPIDQGFERWLHYLVNRDGFDPSLWFLAIDGDEIAGMALCRPQADDDAEIGWIGELCVRRPWRKKGLGLALLQHAFAEFRDRGKRGTGLGVDAENLTGALHLYERAGMHVERNRLTYDLELRPGIEKATESL